MGVIDISISLVLGLIMFGIGSSLKFSDFKSMYTDKKPFITGLVFQMFFLPVFGWLLVSISDLSPEYKVGLFIIAICPGGTSSNFISYIVKADVALSLTLTSINSFLILLTIPLLSQFALTVFIEGSEVNNISIVNTFFQVLLILLLPAVLGILFNENMSSVSKKLQTPLKYINSLLLAIVFGIKFFADKSMGGSGISAEEIFHLLPYTLMLHFGAMLGSYFFSRKYGISNFQSTTIGIEVGLQNTALALLITGTLIGNNEMTKPALVFAIFSFFTTLVFGYFAMKSGQILSSLFKKSGRRINS